VRLTAVALGSVNATVGARQMPIILWIEPTLSHFRKFVNERLLPNHLAMLATTRYSVLQDLQDFIYDKSQARFTICDLQGNIHFSQFIK
jgi:hypothetical protein